MQNYLQYAKYMFNKQTTLRFLSYFAFLLLFCINFQDLIKICKVKIKGYSEWD